MGALCKNEKRVSRCMGTHLLSVWSRLVSLKGSPQNVPNHLFLHVFEAFWSPIEAPELRTPKNGPPQVDAKELPRQSHKTFIFRTYFANFALRDTFGGRSQRALHLENRQKSIVFITFLTPLLGPTWGTTRNIKNCKMSATLHGSAPAKKKRAPRCMGTFSQVRWSRWVPQKRPPQNSPNSLF